MVSYALGSSRPRVLNVDNPKFTRDGTVTAVPPVHRAAGRFSSVEFEMGAWTSSTFLTIFFLVGSVAGTFSHFYIPDDKVEITNDNGIKISDANTNDPKLSYQDEHDLTIFDARETVAQVEKLFGKNWIMMGDSHGEPRFGILRKHERDLHAHTHDIKHLIFPRHDPNGVPTTNINTTYYDPTLPTKIIIHGWTSSSHDSIVRLIRKAYARVGTYNIIACDWGPISHDVVYSRAAHSTNLVGVILGMFIDNLVKVRGSNYSDFHLIGHSLGAHVASAAGKFVKQKVGRITCLDPAAPCFVNDENCNMLSPLTEIKLDDALFVDAIHTCVGSAGIREAIAHADFFPNGGSPSQPGCPSVRVLQEACSHCRSYEYFAESVDSTMFVARKCDSYKHYTQGKCDDNESVIMGEHIDTNVTGVFYLKTHSKTPFAMG
ncbi:hypothetical protein RUM44_012316 [Polyplax serrata]|uniref:Lipase domain-containing protein n=1 Tax=Polyplax serrata TaxID=468196 RepID=A0ABR1BAY4_POLSC